MERLHVAMLANMCRGELEQMKSASALDDGVPFTARREHVRVGTGSAAGRTATAGNATYRDASMYHGLSFYFVHDQRQFRSDLEAAGTAIEKRIARNPAMELWRPVRR